MQRAAIQRRHHTTQRRTLTGVLPMQAQHATATFDIAAQIQELQVGVARPVTLGERAERGQPPGAIVRIGTAQHGTIVQQQRASFGDHQFAVDIACSAQGDRGVEYGAAGAAHRPAHPCEVVAQREVAAAEIIDARLVGACPTDGRIASEREAPAAECEQALASHVQFRRELVARVAVGEQTQRAAGLHVDRRARVRTEHRGAASARGEIDVAVGDRGVHDRRRRQVQRAAVLHIEPVIVVDVECSGNIEPPLQELVGGALWQCHRTAHAGGARSVHAATGPAEEAVDGQVATAGQSAIAQREHAVAIDHRVSGQGKRAAGDGKAAIAAQCDID